MRLNYKKYLHPPERMKVINLADYQKRYSKLKSLIGKRVAVRFYWEPYHLNFFIMGDYKDHKNRIILYEYNFRKESKYKKFPKDE